MEHKLEKRHLLEKAFVLFFFFPQAFKPFSSVLGVVPQHLPAVLGAGQALVTAGRFHKVMVGPLDSDISVYTLVYSKITRLSNQE